MRGQNKDVAQIKAQINALQGVTNDAGMAELAKLRAELAEKESEREDTIRNHSYELQRDGYSQLSQDATESLNNTLTAIEANAQKEEAVVTNMLMRLVETYNTTYGDIATNVGTHTAAIAENVSLSTQNTVASIQEGTAAQQEAISLSYDGMLDAIETNYELAYGAINEVITTSGTTVNDTTKAAIEDINTSIFTILEGTGSVDTSIINTGNTITSTINTSVGHAKSTLMSLGTEITSTFDGVAVSIAKALETAKIDLGYGDAGKQGTVANIEQQLKQDTEKKIADAKAAKLASEKKTEPAKKDPITPENQPAKKTSTPAQPAKKEEPKKTGGTFTVKPAKTSYTYTGKAIKPGVTVTANGKAVGAGSYSVTYSNNVKVGTATIKVTGKGNYAGWSGSCTFTIKAKKKKKSGGDGKARVGDRVTYANGVYHGDSYGGGASGYMYRGQKVYITKINSGSSYPYHISTGSSLGSGDLGWVKLSQLKGYRTGTLGTKKNELNWTHEGEIIRTSDGGMLRQLSAGTQVIPKELSANLMKWGEYDPAKLFSGNGSSVNAAVVQPVSMGVTNHYDALIKVEGNVDADVMSRMEDLGKMLLNDRNFKAGTVNLITKEFTREYRKTGH